MGLIRIKDLTFEYFRRDKEGNLDEMIEALKGVSFEVNKGEFVAIVGRNGSGKSTLAKHINALLLPSEGEIIVDGLETTDDVSVLKIRKETGMIFQNPDNQMVGNLVEEDVAFGPENIGVATEEIWNRVEKSLETVEMEEYRQVSPNHLSGGQKQRVAIAGVLAMEPQCIIFDEATSMLDPQGREQIIFTARQLQKENNITIIFITHHMEEVIWADRVFVMDKGKVMAQGTPKEIFGEEKLLERCGLEIPPLYQYLSFLKRENVFSEEECDAIHGEADFLTLLSAKAKEIYGIYSQRTGIQSVLSENRFENVDGDADTEKHIENTSYDEEMLTNGIFLNHVDYTYHQGFANETVGVKDVTLHIGKGEFVAIIGETGSGKTTMMQMLNGLNLPTAGSIYFEGRDITDKDYPMKQLRQKVGLVFQNPECQLFAETVEKDVCFGPGNLDISPVEVQKRAYEAISLVGLPDTIYDLSPLQLSGGEQRRVAIAGVLAMKPNYLVLDEPTSGLDPIAAESLLELLKELQSTAGVTVVMVSHNLNQVAEYADRVVVMSKGKVISDGPTGEVLQQIGRLEQAGLLLPLGIKILHNLYQLGFSVDLKKTKQKDILQELMVLKNYIQNGEK